MKGKTLVIILLVTLFDIRNFSVQSIIEEKLEKLSLYLSNKDAEKAECVWESINFSNIESLSDSLKCMYHYHTTNLDILKGNNTNYLGRKGKTFRLGKIIYGKSYSHGGGDFNAISIQ